MVLNFFILDTGKLHSIFKEQPLHDHFVGFIVKKMFFFSFLVHVKKKNTNMNCTSKVDIF